MTPARARELAWLAAATHALGRRRPVPDPPADLGWDAILAVADTEDLVPAVAFAVGAFGTVPPAIRRRLTDALAASRARHLVMMRELGRVLAHLAAARIAVMPLKGPVLAETVYPDPALRPFADLDLLVAPADRLRADEALRALGHRRVADEHSWEFDIAWDGATLYETPSGIHVDLHWSLLTEPRYAWNRQAETDVWRRAVPLTLAGTRTLTLAPEDLVLYLAVHLAVHHALSGLARHWDLALLLAAAPPDWDVLIARAAEWRVSHALFFVLLGVEAAFPGAVPPRALAALRPRGPRAALVRALLRDADAERRVRLEHLVTLLLMDRGRDVAGALRRTLWPPADWLRARYGAPTASRPALYLAHVRRLGGVLGTASGELAGTGRRRDRS